MDVNDVVRCAGVEEMEEGGRRMAVICAPTQIPKVRMELQEYRKPNRSFHGGRRLACEL